MRRLAKVSSLLVSLWCLSCAAQARGPSAAAGPTVSSAAAPAPAAAEAQFARLASELYTAYFDGIPLGFSGSMAVGLGMHQYDGKLPDESAAGLQRRIAFLAQARARLELLP